MRRDPGAIQFFLFYGDVFGAGSGEGTLACLAPAVRISTPVSVILRQQDPSIDTARGERRFNVQECIFKLGAPFPVMGRRGPVVGPVQVSPVRSQVDHLWMRRGGREYECV